MIGTTTSWITQFAILLIGLTGFVFALAQADCKDRPIARYRAAIMLICSASSGLAFSLPSLFMRWADLDMPSVWMSSSIWLANMLIITIGFVILVSSFFQKQSERNLMDHWIWGLVIGANILFILSLHVVITLKETDYVTSFALTVMFFAAAYWQIAISVLLSQRVVMERA